MIGLLFFCTALLLLAFRITHAPDLFSDEGLYGSVGNNIAAGRGLVENGGAVFVWHPPLYMLIEAGYIRLMGLVDADPVLLLYRLRLINVLGGALIAALLFEFGRRLRGLLSGSIIAALYCLDPYIQRINRRSMLETVAELLLLLGIFVYLQALQSRRRSVLAGVLSGTVLGLAILTKELMALGVLALFVFALLFRRDQLRHVMGVALAALATYSVYPLWLLAAGYWPQYAAMKQSQLLRVVSRVLISSTPATQAGPPISHTSVGLWESATKTLLPYLFSYLTIAAAGVLVLTLILRAMARPRQRPPDAELLVGTWALTSYGVIGSIMLFGNGSDQFFYYLAVPAVVIVGQALTRAIGGTLQTLLALAQRRGTRQGARSVLVGWKQALIMLVAWVALSWNIAIYTQLFVLSQDNSYAAMVDYVNQNIAPGSTMVAGSDLANYLFPNYRVRFDRSAQDLRREQAHYVILSSKERWGGYNSITPDFYDWVVTHGTLRFAQSGTTFWDLQLYEIDPTSLELR